MQNVIKTDNRKQRFDLNRIHKSIEGAFKCARPLEDDASTVESITASVVEKLNNLTGDTVTTKKIRSVVSTVLKENNYADVDYEYGRDHSSDVYRRRILADAVKRMQKIAEDTNCDIETAHSRGDALLCETLDKLGFSELTRIFNAMEKWYA